MRRMIVVLAAVAAVPVGLGACGDEGTETVTEAETATETIQAAPPPPPPKPAKPKPPPPPPPASESANTGGSNCEPGYSPCIPSGVSDLDCGDIGHQVEVTGSDPYLLDLDGDGRGCELY